MEPHLDVPHVASFTPPMRMIVDAVEHRLNAVRQRTSPHADARPDAEDISLLVVHAIALPPDAFGGPWIDDLFTGRLDCDACPYFATLRGVRVSAHACIFRDGSITQYVSFDRRAWHAGVSSFEGRSDCNDFSIGIELEGGDEWPFTDAQYTALGRVGDALLRAYPRLSNERIVGHADIAPGRKTDPGPHFDWPRGLAEIAFSR